MVGFFKRNLTPCEVFWIYLAAVSVFVFPVLNVDYLFLDDGVRALLRGNELWRSQGRILMQLFYNVISFTGASPNIFPLAHFIALPVVALALRAVTSFLFSDEVTFPDCFVVLPLFYCPAYLGLFVYQYDGPAVMLGVSAAIYAVTHQGESKLTRVLIPAAAIAVALAFYQIILNLLVGIYCIEVLLSIMRGLVFSAVVRLIVLRAVQVLLAFVIYYFSAYRFVQTDRTMLLPFDQEWAGLIITRIGSAVEKVVLLVSPGNRWIFVSLGILALIGYLMGGFSIFRLAKSSLEKSLLLGIYLLTIPLLGLTVPGFAVLFQDYTPHAKMLLGLAPVLMASFLFSQRAMSFVHPKVVWLLLLPVFCMLSFSFMYGRVLMAQKVLESSVLNAIAYDLNSREAFRRIDSFYLVGPEHEQMWLPASSAAAHETPALFYVGAWSKEPHNYLVLAEHFPSVGITNVRHMAVEEFKGVAVRESLVNSRFYTIYVSGNEGYIQMKQGKDNGEVSDAGHEGMP